MIKAMDFVKVPNYHPKRVLSKVKKLPSFGGIPKGYWIVGIQSKEDTYNIFDDVFHLFHNETRLITAPGTTNAGTTGLKNYTRYNKRGCAVIKTNEWYYDLWAYGLHRNRMPALKQVNPILYYRDYNKNHKVEETGSLYEGMIGINFHTALYQKNLSFWRKFIGGWSTGCQVVNELTSYYNILEICKDQPKITYCLIKEF